jgi:hypothetical protein
MNLTAMQAPLARMYAGWSRFWFTPADPTVLGAIRLLTGLITFYTLLAYSFDLQALVGPHAWTDLTLRQEQYRDSPIAYDSFDWTGSGRYQPPANEEQILYRDRYIRTWGSPPPLPYPKTVEEAAEYDAYHLRWGVDPRLISGKGRPAWSIWFHVVDPFWMIVVHSAIVVCSFLFFIGFATRITSVLTWIGAMSYIHREPAALFGADTMMNVLLIYLMIGPSGAALSVDRWLRRWWAKWHGLPVPPLEHSVLANLALRCIQIHTCIIYLSAGLSKLQGQAWWTGTAPWGTLANPEYAPMQYSVYLSFLRELAKTRWLYETAMTVGSLGTLAFEIAYPFVIWRPALRTVWLWLAVLLHLGIGAFMGLKTFSILMIAFNMAFLRPETVRWAIAQVTPQKWREQEGELESSPVGLPSPTPIIRQEKSAPKAVAAAHYKRKR